MHAEATALTALYLDASNYPEPVRTQLTADVRVYVDYVVAQA
jgi:hypothetical protein